MAPPGVVQITGPAYPVATGGFVSGSGSDITSGTFWSDQRDTVTVELETPHIVVRTGWQAARLDKAAALRVADALREMAEQLP
jgi:hypothetical protein